MIGLAAAVVGILFAASVYLMLSSDVQRAVIGFVALTNAANLLVLAASGLPPDAIPALIGEHVEGTYTDPLPQAFILTAIVIGLGNTAFLIYMAAAARREAGPDEAGGTEWD